MNQVTCPYITISETQAQELALNNTSVFSTGNFSIVSTAYAQTSVAQPLTSVTQTISEQMSGPFLLLIGSFFLFVALMSVVYMYHWYKFSLNDPFIKSFIPIYFFGLLILSIPLIFNLFF